MKKNALIFVLILSVFINLYAQTNSAETDLFRQEGIASWYGKEFEGRPTASGEIYDSSKLTAAHPTLPFGTMLVVTNQHNNKKVTVRVNDRGPFVAARIIDVSRAAAEQLDMITTGTAPVTVESMERIPVTVTAQKVEMIQVQPAQNESAVQIQPAAEINPASIIQPAGTHTVSQAAPQIKITPQIAIIPNKTYRLQVGSYRNAKNAVNAFDKLKSSGLNPAYEKFNDTDTTEFFRVVVAGIPGNDVQSIIEKIRLAGFKEAIIREEN